MEKERKGGVHTGHRARMKQRFTENDGKGLADHELLEMLLYYIIPRCDTNDLAHRLIEEFGSLVGVLEADAAMLCRVDGIKENAALYLKLLGETARRYTSGKLFDEKAEAPAFDTPAKIAAFMIPRYMGINVERVYLLLFDNAMHMIDCYHVCDGSISGVALSIRRIVERAYRKGATAAILTHNHPGGMISPSGDDIQLTRRLDEALRLMEIPLLEHYVFAERRYAPIMSAQRAKSEAEYAASSLVDLLHARLSAHHGLIEE
ncbi:MAG: RadC family protein [Clostridia bacterium]|nr:RadC family protein [Clostridia bacterium]